MLLNPTLLCGIILYLLTATSCRQAPSETATNTQPDGETTQGGNTPSAEHGAAPADTTPAQMLLDSAKTLLDSGRYDEGLEKSRQALTIYLQSVAETDTILVQPLNLKSEFFWRTNELDSALASAEQALIIGLNGLRKDHPSVATTYHHLGVVHLMKADYEQALVYNEKAVQIYRKAQGSHQLSLASALDNTGIIHYSQGDYEQSLTHFENALNLRLRSAGRDHPDIADSYHRIGVLNSVQGAYDRGLSYYKKALAIRLKTHGTEHPSVGETYNNMGINYENIGDFERALSCYEKSLDILLITLGPDHPHLMSIYGNTGDLYREMRAYDLALSSYRKAVEIQMKARSAIHTDLAWIYQGMAAVHLDRGAYRQALGLYEEALSIRLATQPVDHPNVADVYNYIGKVHLAKGEYHRGFTFFQKSCRILDYDLSNPGAFDEVPDLKLLHSVLSNIKDYYTYKADQTDDTIYLDSLYSHYQRMLSLEDYLQQEYSSATIRRVYAARSLPVYEGAIDNLLKLKQQLPEAFLLAERTKSRQLVEKIQAAPHTVSFGIPDSLRKKEHKLSLDIANFEKKVFQEEFENESPNDALLDVYNNTLFDLREERARLLETFRTHYSEYYRLRYSTQLMDIAGVRKKLLQHERHALVEYFVGDSAIYIFTVLPDTFHIRKVRRDFPLEQWVTELRCGLFATYLSDAGCDSLQAPAGQALYAQRAYELYQKLFAPVDTLLPPDAEVLLVPDGLLGYLPFEALLTQKPAEGAGFYQYAYLLREHLISYAYSATLQQEMQNKKHRQVPRKKLIAIAPSFWTEDCSADSALLVSRFINPQLRRNRLPPLHHNRAEAEAVAAIFGGQVLSGAEATEAAFRQRAGDYRILHLATHSKANDRAGDYSFLAFHTLDDSLENEWLYNSELYNLQLHADLVVLSACETGIGELQRGEGIISLARGFSYAGAKSIVTSIWNVSDRHTQDLMTRFYTYLNEGLPKHRALRQAKLDYLDKQEGPARSPFFWAGFIPIGDTAPVASSQNGYWKALTALGILLLAGEWLWRQKNIPSG